MRRWKHGPSHSLRTYAVIHNYDPLPLDVLRDGRELFEHAQVPHSGSGKKGSRGDAELKRRGHKRKCSNGSSQKQGKCKSVSEIKTRAMTDVPLVGLNKSAANVAVLAQDLVVWNASLVRKTKRSGRGRCGDRRDDVSLNGRLSTRAQGQNAQVNSGTRRAAFETRAYPHYSHQTAKRCTALTWQAARPIGGAQSGPSDPP